MKMKTRLSIAIGVCVLVLLSALFQCLSFNDYTHAVTSSIHAPTISSTASIAAEDRISPETFKQLADFYFGYDSSASAHPTPLTQNSSIETMIPNRSVVFVNSWEMKAFIEKILPRISVSIVLVTGDTTGVSMPLGVLGTQETAKLAAEPRILRWFTMNCDEGAQTFAHKIKCIPIGVNSYIDSLILLQELHQEGVGLVGGGIKQNLRTHKPAGKNTLLVSFNTFTNEAVREPVFRLFCGDAGDDISNGMRVIRESLVTCYVNNTMPQKEFYKSYLSTARYVLAPHGNGLDSYRVWETLLLGSYPIVKTSSLDSLYQDLPVIVVDEWDSLTPELLQKEFARFRSLDHNYERLYSRYWRNVMRQKVFNNEKKDA